MIIEEILKNVGRRRNKVLILVSRETFRDIIYDPMIRYYVDYRNGPIKELAGHELIIADLDKGERYRIVLTDFDKPFAPVGPADEVVR